jgi:DNA-directed RNA polymerase subunit RPC12/RpoP
MKKILITCSNCGLTFPVPVKVLEGLEPVYCPECEDEIPEEDLED